LEGESGVEEEEEDEDQEGAGSILAVMQMSVYWIG